MEMKSKYNIGDILYSIDNLKIVKIEVSSISIVTTKEYTHVYYHRDGGYRCFSEKEVFGSEAELIAYLKRAEDGENSEC